MFSCFFIIKKKKTVLKRNFQTGLWISISWSQVPTHEDVGEGMECVASESSFNRPQIAKSFKFHFIAYFEEFRASLPYDGMPHYPLLLETYFL